MVKFSKMNSVEFKDYEIVVDEDPIFYKLNQLILNRSLLDLFQRDSVDFFIANKGTLGHSLISFRSPQENSYQIVGADLEIRSTKVLSNKTSVKHSKKEFNDLVSLYIKGRISQNLDSILKNREKTYFFSDLSISIRYLNQTKKNLALSYSGLEPFVEKPESEEFEPSSNTSSLNFYSNLESVSNFKIKFLDLLKEGLSEALPKFRKEDVFEQSSGKLEERLFNEASKFLVSGNHLEFPFMVNLTHGEYNTTLIQSYLKYFGFNSN